MTDASERSLANEGEEPCDGGVIAHDVPDHRDAAGAAGMKEELGGRGSIGGQRLLDEDVRPGPKCREGMLRVPFGRGGDDDGIDASTERVGKACVDLDAGCERKRPSLRGGMGIHDGDQLGLGVSCDLAEQIASPASAADERGSDGPR